MSDTTDDMIDGTMCSQCGTYFVKPHGYPVACEACWLDMDPKERRESGLQRAAVSELR